MTLSAQESDLYNNLLKESLHTTHDLDFSFEYSSIDFFNKSVKLDATKQYIPHLGFNYFQNYLIISIFTEYPKCTKGQTISPYLPTPYINKKTYQHHIKTDNLITNVELHPHFKVILFNPLGIINYLTQVEAFPNSTYVSKKSKKEKALKTIKEIYNMDF
jgi:hypothetical protein